MRLLQLFLLHQNLKCALRFQIAGFGVFAGQAFKKDDFLPATWKTLFLPANFPKNQVLRNYGFTHNATHIALVLDYGSIANHHESANVEAVHFPKLRNFHFRVRGRSIYANRNALNRCRKCLRDAENACVHAYIAARNTSTHKHF